MASTSRDPHSREWFGTLPSGRTRFVSASFKKLDDAIDATRDLERRGFGREQISVFMTEETRESHIDTHPRFGELEEKAVVVDQVALQKERKTLEGAGAGGSIGGALGAAGAAIAAAGTTLLIPPLGIAVAGPLAAVLAGAGAGAATGGVVGALVGAGMTEYRAKRFERLVKEGNVLVGAVAETDVEHTTIVEVLKQQGGHLVRRQEDEE